MKVYPRIELDITIKDLSSSLFSLFPVSERATTVTQIQSFWHTDKDLLVTLCARTSFDLLLRSLCLPTGSEIIMSAVNIVHMEEIVKMHKCVPVPVDIDLETLAPSLELFKASISNKSRIFVIAHLFGSVIPLAPYMEVCKINNILLVEDCAQAFAGFQYHGYAAADISLFSFGPIKSCTALGGAVTLVKNRNLAEKMRRIEQTYPDKSDLWFLKRLLKYLCLKSLSAPNIFGIFIAGLHSLQIDSDKFICSLARGFSKGDILSQLRYRPPHRMLKLLQHRLNNLDRWRYERREKLAIRFFDLLNKSDTKFGRKTIQNSYWLVALLIKNPSVLRQKLMAEGFDATTGTTSLTFIGEESVRAKRLINNALYLPIYPSLPEVELARLAELINAHLLIK